MHPLKTLIKQGYYTITGIKSKVVFDIYNIYYIFVDAVAVGGVYCVERLHLCYKNVTFAFRLTVNSCLCL